jgi:lipopolysaccharide export system permease protein
MRILNIYLIKTFFKPFIFASVAFGVIVMISEFFREMNFYIKNKTSFFTVLEYLFLNLPWWIIQVLPVSVLLALLFSLGDLAKRNEITAMKAAGINLWRLVTVFMFIGLFIGAGDLAVREFVIPHTKIIAEKIKKEKIRKEAPSAQYKELRNFIVALPYNERMSIGYFNPREGIMKDVIIDAFDDNFHLKRHIIAAEMVWNNGLWIMKHGVKRNFNENEWTESYFNATPSGISLTPDDFVIKKVSYEQLSVPQFKRYIEQLQMFGNTAVKERIALNMRYASVFSHLIVMMIGIPFALGLGKRFGKILSFSFALIFSFIYWGAQSVSQSFGENMLISPVMSAWLPNIVFAIVGIFLLAKVKK